MPLPSRYLPSRRQISRFQKLHGKGMHRPRRLRGHAAGDDQGRDGAFGGQLPSSGSGAQDSPNRGVLRFRPDRPPLRSLPARTVEFPVSYAAEKSMPLVRREPEDQPARVPAVANADLAIGQARHLDAIAVGVAQRALNPVRTRTRPFVRTPERSTYHVTPSLVGVFSRCVTSGDGEPDGFTAHSLHACPPRPRDRRPGADRARTRA
jgi:hypothetical protein